jgi:hypothetical protein
MDNIVDRLDEAIKLYVTKVTRESLDDRDGRRAMEVISFAINLEHIGDIIDKNLMELANKKIKHKYEFSTDGATELDTFHKRIIDNLKLAFNWRPRRAQAFEASSSGFAAIIGLRIAVSRWEPHAAKRGDPAGKRTAAAVSRSRAGRQCHYDRALPFTALSAFFLSCASAARYLTAADDDHVSIPLPDYRLSRSGLLARADIRRCELV